MHDTLRLRSLPNELWTLALLALLMLCGQAPAQNASPASSAIPDHARRSQHFLAGRTGTPDAVRRLDLARARHRALLAQPRTAALSAAWTPVGPAQVLSATYGLMTGRVSSLAIDPADPSGNTVYVGTTGGGVWRSTNAAGPASAVSFIPLTDTLSVFSANAGSSVTPSLSIGALAVGGGVLLAGTGDPNDATDSYYGAGLLRSIDNGTTWTLVQQSLDGVAGNHTFFGLSFAGLAFSTANPSLAVAAVSQAAEGTLVNAPNRANSVMGLYYSTDAGVTWQMASLYDGSQVVQTPLPSGGNGGGNAATAVVWNPVRRVFLAAVRYHGYYQSADGMTWTRLAHQPGTGLTSAACPPDAGGPGSAGCPIFRGALAVQPVTGDTFALTTDAGNRDQGLWQDACALSGGTCAGATLLFGKDLAAPGSSPLETGFGVAGGSTVIPQADYDLSLAAVTSGTDTLLYAGTVDLYRCSLAGGCTLRNTTDAQNGCTHPAGVAPAQHALAVLGPSGGPLLYLGTDGGIYRSSDGAAVTGPACAATDASHFQNLNGGIGSLAEVVSFAQHPSDAATLLAGLGALGTAGTGTAAGLWTQLATGEGGTVAIDQTAPLNWYLSSGAGVSLAYCGLGAGCTAGSFTLPATIGEAQVSDDVAAIDAPWLLDPALPANVVIGTCRVWRGPAQNGAQWSASNALSRPFATPAATACSSNAPVVRTLAAGGAVSNASATQNEGSEVLYAGMAGALDGGSTLGGHVFVTTAAQSANNATVWTDAAASPVTNGSAGGSVFNAAGFDISSVVADPHDATGATVYATVMGFAGNSLAAAHVYRSVDAGAHWLNVSSNLPNAPANALVVDPNDANTVYVAMDTGVYVTTEVTACATANCWSVFGSALPNAPVVGLAAAAAVSTGDGRTGELRAATYGRGLWAIPLLTAVSAAAPGLAVSPTSVSFAAQASGTLSAPVTVTVTNTGNAPLTVSSVTTTGDFNETDTCAGAPIAQGATCTVSVRFLPTATGPRTGLLTVYGNAPGGQATATLSGTGTVPPAVVLTPAAATFASTSIGSQSAAVNLTLSNTGTTTVGLQSIALSGDFKFAANTCGSSLAANTGCTVAIVFAPIAAGTRTGALTALDGAGTQTASLTGVGTAPATDALSPMSLSFAPQPLAQLSALQSVTLVNAGDVALTLIAAQIAGGDFTVTNNCGNSLSGHSTCTLQVGFAPHSLGPQTGVLTVSDQFRSQTVQLAGTGLAPAGVSVAPIGGLTFAATGLGQSSAAQTVTVTNNGGSLLTIAGTAITGDFSLQPGANTCGTTLAPATACTLGVIFTPAVPGPRNGTLAFTDSAGSSPQVLNLTGTGVDFSLAPDGATTQTVSSGGAATYLLLLGSAASVPGSVAFTCAGMPANTRCTVNPAIGTLGGSSVITVTVATGVSTVELRPYAPFHRRDVRNAIAWAALLPLLLLGVRRRRRLLGGAGLCLLALVAGCGSNRLIPGDGTTTPAPTLTTPSGSYNLTVTGSSIGLVRSVNLTLVVQ